MSVSETDQANRRPWLSWIVLLLLMGVALILRWRYIHEISLSVDEFNTLWAAKQIPIRGLPIFPSGNLYPHGFLFTYLAVPFVLGQFSETVARIPGLIVGMAGLPVAYWVGRKLFSDKVGLMAAAAMAVDPDCVIWGGRARMYGLLQLLTLLAIYFYYRGLVDDRPRDRVLAMVFVSAGIFSHAEAILLLPALALATFVAMLWGVPLRLGLRRLLRWSVALPYVIAAVAAAGFFLMSKFGQPGHLETLQETRPYLDLSSDLLSGPRAFASVFIGFHRLPFSLLALAGLAFVFRPRFDGRSPLTYLYIGLIGFLIPMIFLAGATWQNARYLFMLLPLLFLIGSQVLCRFLNWIPVWKRLPAVPAGSPGTQWQAAILAIAVALFVGLTGTRSAYQQDLGYDQAFRYLRDQAKIQPDERVLTTSPTACMLYLGRCDHFAIQRGYREYLIPRPGDGVPAELWTATPVLTTTAALTELLSTAPSVWLVTDGWRFQTRYDADFIQTVIDQMDLARSDRGVLIFHGEGYRPTAPSAVRRERLADFGDQMALVGFGLSSSNPQPGDELEITLEWKSRVGVGPAYTAFLHLLAEDGSGVAGVDEPLLRSFFQPDLWPKEMVFSDRHRLRLPADLPAGRYRLDLGLYPTGKPDQLVAVDGNDHLSLATLMVGKPGMPGEPVVRTIVDFGDQIRLLGYDLLALPALTPASPGTPGSPGDCNLRKAPCSLQLYWQSLAPTDRDYTVFVHLTGPDGDFAAQDDAPPGGPFLPTSTWLPGQVASDPHTLVVPADLPPGAYTLLVGLYHRPTRERLQATDAEGNSLGDAFLVATLQIGTDAP